MHRRYMPFCIQGYLSACTEYPRLRHQKEDSRELKVVQKRATKWIKGNEKTCKETERTGTATDLFLPRVARHTLFLSLLKGKYDVDVASLPFMNENTTRQGTRRFLLPKTSLGKTEDNFFVRVRRRSNLLKKVLEVEPRLWSKKSVTNLY